MSDNTHISKKKKKPSSVTNIETAQPYNKINKPKNRSVTNLPPTQPDTAKKQSFPLNPV
jgi:hypothetical protein